MSPFLVDDSHRSVCYFLGLMKHSQAIIKAYLADITPPNERPAALGFLNALCSSGFIVGPVIGGHIAMTDNGFHKVAFLSGLIFFVNGSFVTLIAPSVAKEAEQANDVITANPKERPDNDGSSNDEFSSLRNKPYDASLHNDEKEGNKDSNSTKPPASFNPIREFVKSVRHVPWSNIFDVFLVRFLTSLAMVIFRSSFSVVLEFRHGSTPKMNGYLMSYNAILGVIGGASVGKFARLFSSSEAMHRFFSTILVLSLGFITAAPRIEYVIAGLVPLCVSTSVLRVTSATAMYNRGGEGEKGLLTGLGDSFMSMSRMIGPTIGGIAQDHNIYGPGIVSTLLAIAGTSLSFLFDMGTFKIDFKKKKLQ